MHSIEICVKQLEKNPHNVSFSDLCNVCESYFGKPRSTGSHYIYKTPWQGDPRINIQNDKGQAKAYQVRQVIKALRRLEAEVDE
jgi:hypothetical protein